MFTVGIDWHQRSSSVCVLDEQGHQVRNFVMRDHPRALVERLQRELDGQPFQVCFEASCGSGTLFDLLSPIAARVVVMHPARLRLIFASKRKNDRIDAQRLAKLLYLDEAPQVHVPDLEVRCWRELIQTRNAAVTKRTRAKNGLRALLRSLLIKAPPGLWTHKGRAWLAELELPFSTAIRRDLLLEEITHFDEQIRVLNAALDRIGSTHAGVTLLQTIPGVGPRTAEAFCAFVDNPGRFGSKQIGCYLGLVPMQDQSGSKNRMGRITREGPAVVRRLLTEAAWRSTQHSPGVKAFFDRVKREDKERRKIALIATAHYLARVMLAMLQTGEVWRESAVCTQEAVTMDAA